MSKTITVDHGFLEYRHAPGDTCEIINIEVDKEYQGVGIGSRMLKILEKLVNAKSVYAFTSESNVLAQRWYKKQGFNLVLVANFYGKGKSAFLCWKTY